MYDNVCEFCLANPCLCLDRVNKNKEIVMEFTPDDCQIDKAMKLDQFRQIGENLSWALTLQHFQLTWYERLFARFMVWLNKKVKK